MPTQGFCRGSSSGWLSGRSIDENHGGPFGSAREAIVSLLLGKGGASLLYVPGRFGRGTTT